MMTTAATQQPDGLSYWDLEDPRTIVGQTRAVALMRSDKRASYKHFAILEFHWGWAHQKYNHTSLASVRKIHATLLERNPLGEAQISLPHISAANRDLVEWGWLFELDKGTGRSASRFIPNYAIFKVAAEGNFRAFLDGVIDFSVYPLGERNGFGISVNPMGNSGVTYEVNANRFCVNHEGNKDSLTETGRKDRSTEREIDPAPATPPLPVGLSATVAEGSGGGFEELWKAYGHRQKKADAKAAYLKVAPDADQHAHMVDAARAWFAAWEAQGKTEAPRFTLAKWIEREEFECDPPSAFKTKERKTKAAAPAKPAPKASNDNLEDDEIYLTHGPMVCDVGVFSPFGTFEATIVGSEVERVDEFTEKVVIKLRWSPQGIDAEHTFYFQHPDPALQKRGRAFVRTLADCVGIDELTDTEQLHDCSIICTINNKLAISYRPAA